ncbi:MAG: hypothetical protein NW215_04660 [Hyphomicrobiales bacterium]|nr:hypothetical protein [Hyphomicrobiales bacterium]
MKRLCLLPLLVLAGCGAPAPDRAPELQFDPARFPRGISTVASVQARDLPGDQIELTAYAAKSHKMQDLMAVLWCRARQEAVARRYDGWYAESFRQAFAAEGGAQAAIGVVKMFRGPPPPGKETLARQKNWCSAAPRAALAP